jgi:BolA family transcriptional regulator, general stress-responsive regulator
MRQTESPSGRKATVAEKIKAKLETALDPQRLEVEDQSHRHAGHAGWREGGETHFSIKVASARFSGKGRLERHRMVYALLADEIAGGVHALQIEALAPGDP